MGARILEARGGEIAGVPGITPHPATISLFCLESKPHVLHLAVAQTPSVLLGHAHPYATSEPLPCMRELRLGPRAPCGRSLGTPGSRRPGRGASEPRPRQSSSGSCQTGNIFREPEGLASPGPAEHHNGPLCRGFTGTHPQAQLLGQGGPCFLVCSQTQLPNNQPSVQTRICLLWRDGSRVMV